MTNGSQGPNKSRKWILAGLAGLIGWRAIGQKGQGRVLGFVDVVLENATREMREKQEAEERERRKQQIPTSLAIESAHAPTTPLHPTEQTQGPRSDSKINAALEQASQPLMSTLILEPDAKWREVVVPPSVVLIVGKRGSGKSALGYRLLELFRYLALPYVVGAPSTARAKLPDWIGIAPSLDLVPSKSVVLVDEAYLHYHARGSMAQESKAMSQAVNLSRQREQTLIFVSQEARQVDRNISSSASVLVFKDLGMLQLEFDRREFNKLATQAKEAFATVRGDKRRSGFVYAPDSDYLGLLDNELPSFWKPSLSQLFAADATPATSRASKRITPQEKARKAMEMRAAGASYKEIAEALGVTKPTVVNYLRGYPYQPK